MALFGLLAASLGMGGCGDDEKGGSTGNDASADARSTDGAGTGADATRDGGTSGSEAGSPGDAPSTDGMGGDLSPVSDAAPVANTAVKILGGSFAPLTGYESKTGLAGKALLVVTTDGKTTASAQVVGLDPNKMFPVHVHAGPCSAAGLGHYLIDPKVMGTVEANEIWPVFTTNGNGIGTGRATVSHAARGDAMSIVIHDPDMNNAKMACADLRPQDQGNVSAQGTIKAFAMAEMADQTIAGTVRMDRKANGTVVDLDVMGLNTQAQYAAHVHALPCDVDNAGAHYKIDPTMMATVEANELWPAIMPGKDRSASKIDSPHVAREDAQSVVVHRIVGMMAPKVACGNLVRASYPDFATKGMATKLAAADMQGVGNLKANATMTRGLDGKTVVTLSADGFGAGKKYASHVHDQPCASGDGGAHYKIDPAVMDTKAENEIWLDFTADEKGSGESTATVSHVARAEAQSIVIHGEGGARLACLDLK